MSLTAARNTRTKSPLVSRACRNDADQDIQAYEVGESTPYGKEYFLGFTQATGWESNRNLPHVEVPILDCSDDLIEGIKAFVGDDENSPNWDYLEEVTIGMSFGANQNNFLIWQGSQYWNINQVILGQHSKCWPSTAPWYIRNA